MGTSTIVQPGHSPFYQRMISGTHDIVLQIPFFSEFWLECHQGQNFPSAAFTTPHSIQGTMAIVSDQVSKYRWDIGLFTVIVRDGEGSKEVFESSKTALDSINGTKSIPIYPITQFKMAIGLIYDLLCQVPSCIDFPHVTFQYIQASFLILLILGDHRPQYRSHLAASRSSQFCPPLLCFLANNLI